MAEKARPAIFAFTTAYFPFIGGAELAIQETARRLANEYRFFIITARLRRDLPRISARPEGTVIRVGFGFSGDKMLLPIFGTFKTLRLMRRVKPMCFWGVMVTYASIVPYLVNIIRLRERVPVLLTLQEGDSEEHIKSKWGGMIARSWRLALPRSDVLHVISTYLGGLARSHGWRGEAVVIPNGVDASAFGTKLPRDARIALRREFGFSADDGVVITTSRLVVKNGIDTLIRAIHHLNTRRIAHPVKLLIVGEGALRGELEALVRDLGEGSAVRFAGAVPFGEIPRYLGCADVFCRPSRSEGLGNVFLEAMAAGLPVVATAVGGIPDFLRDGENGLAARPDAPEDIAEKIEFLLDDEALRERIAAAGRKTAAGYGWEGIAEKFGRIFRNLAAQSGRVRVFIATPLVPPAVGGPATYVGRLAPELAAAGHPVTVLSYQAPRGARTKNFFLFAVSPRWPSGLKHIAYFLKSLRELARADVAIGLDPFIVGVPLAAAARLLRKPVALRVEGDFLWEQFVERNHADYTLTGFYDQIGVLALSLKERVVHGGMRWVSRSADRLVFSSAWRRAIVERAYGTNPAFARVIPPPLFAPGAGTGAESGAGERERVLLFAGRFVWVKNLRMLVRTFLRAAPPGWRLELIGEGPEKPVIEAYLVSLGAGKRVLIRPPLPSELLHERLGRVRGVFLPSLSDVSPNLILEAIAAGTPFLMTCENGFREMLGGIGLYADPLNESEIEEGIRHLADDATPALYRKELERLKPRSWEDVRKEWERVIAEVVP